MLFESHLPAVGRRALHPPAAELVSFLLQPGDDPPELGRAELLPCRLHRQPTAFEQVGENLALWVCSHSLVVLVCARVGGQATPGKSFRLRGSLRLIARSLVFVGCPPGRRQVGLRVYRRFRHSHRVKELDRFLPCGWGYCQRSNPSPRWVAMVGVAGFEPAKIRRPEFLR